MEEKVTRIDYVKSVHLELRINLQILENSLSEYQGRKGSNSSSKTCGAATPSIKLLGRLF